MKKLLTLPLAIAILALLSSCGKNTWLIKRHYTPGYYVSHKSGKKNVTEDYIARGGDKSVNPPVYAQNHISNTANTAAGDPVIEKMEVPTALAPVYGSQPKVNTEKERVGESKTKKYPVYASKIKTGLKEMRSTSRSSDGDRALSWVWIIIVVVLILWAIGFIAGGLGLGNLINLLLLVALILLILWLLRII